MQHKRREVKALSSDRSFCIPLKAHSKNVPVVGWLAQLWLLLVQEAEDLQSSQASVFAVADRQSRIPNSKGRMKHRKLRRALGKGRSRRRSRVTTHFVVVAVMSMLLQKHWTYRHLQALRQCGTAAHHAALSQLRELRRSYEAGFA